MHSCDSQPRAHVIVLLQMREAMARQEQQQQLEEGAAGARSGDVQRQANLV